MAHGSGPVIANGRWRARRWFWNRFAIFKYSHNHPTPVPLPVPDRAVGLVPVASQYRHVPIERALVADRIPSDERQTVKRVFSRIQAALYRLVPPQQRGLPPTDADPHVALDKAYTAAHRRRFPAPERPASLDGPDLGALAVASPFACYLAANGDGTFGWDLRVLDEFECHPGLRALGVVVTFAAESSDSTLTAVRIDCDAGSCTPSDPDWQLARRLALTAASTHLSLVRHFGWIHLASGGPLAVVTRNRLPADHPVRRLVWPHVYATQYSNDLITLDQLTIGGDFESIFSFTHKGVNALIDATIDAFDFGVVDPDVDASARGLEGVATPSIDNRRQHHAVFVAHARRYLERYYDDDRIAADTALNAWRVELSKRMRGVDRVAGETVTIDGTARLVAAIIQLATVEHEILGSGMWDYQLWSDAVPARLPIDGTPAPLDVYQRLVNANFNLNVHRTALLSDFSSLALDANGADAFRAFQADLRTLQATLDAGTAEPWRMEPKRLKANINA
jgi:arachidonate 15-lipoxygenase